GPSPRARPRRRSSKRSSSRSRGLIERARGRRRVTSLPIHAVLPDLLAALRAASNAVLVAPPGAGRTTAAAPALLVEPWCTGAILLLSPRRVAARAAAGRMAEPAAGGVGERIG